MHRYPSIQTFENPSLAALRRTICQLCLAGIGAAIVIAGAAPDMPALALWCALAPLTSLATHCRHGAVAWLRGWRRSRVSQRPW